MFGSLSQSCLLQHAVQVKFSELWQHWMSVHAAAWGISEVLHATVAAALLVCRVAELMLMCNGCGMSLCS